MSRSIALFGLKVLPGEIVPGDEAEEALPYRITMAAIDPSAAKDDQFATLKLLKRPIASLLDDYEYSSDEDEDGEELSEEDQQLLRDEIKRLSKQRKDEGSEDDEDEDEEGSEDEAELKQAKAEQAKNGETAEDEDEDDDEDSDSDDEEDFEDFVLCTIKPGQNQQALDVTVGENDEVYFQNTGDLPIYLTGNYVIHPEQEDYESDEDDYDLSPNEDELVNGYGNEESDELDSLAEERIQELPEEGEQKSKAGKKRAAQESDEEATLDDIMAEVGEEVPEKKLSKKERKKLKANDGKAVDAPKKADGKAEKTAKAEEDKPEKSVKFAKNLEQGPSPSGGAKTLEGGVTVVDKKVGKGRKIKAGDKIGVRYIGKLESGKVFDSNKSGKPFRLTLGKGEVIKGWDIGLTGMALEGERLVTIPPAMAYGKKGQPGIPANSTLRFEVKLVEVK